MGTKRGARGSPGLPSGCSPPAAPSRAARCRQTDPPEGSGFSKSHRIVPVKPSERLQIRCCENAFMAAQLSSVFPHLQTPTLFPLPRTGRHSESKSAAPALSFAVRGSPQQQPPRLPERRMGTIRTDPSRSVHTMYFPGAPVTGGSAKCGEPVSLVGGSELQTTPKPPHDNRPWLYL